MSHVSAVMAMAIGYNWLKMFGYTFYKWADLLVLITGISSEKYESVGMIIPNIWKNKKGSKPPTTNLHFQ